MADRYTTTSLHTDSQKIPVKITSSSKPKVDTVLLDDWQGIVDLCARIMDVAASLIIKIDHDTTEPLVTSNSKGNPFSMHSDALLGIDYYCKTVIATNAPLIVSNGQMDTTWRDIPDIDQNLVAFMGFPILWPDNEVFGVICVIDDKTNSFSDDYLALLSSLRMTIEKDLALRVVDYQHQVGILESIGNPIFMIDAGLNIIGENDQAIRCFGDGRNTICYEFFFEGQKSPCEGCPVLRSLEKDVSCEYGKTFNLPDREQRYFWCTTGIVGHDLSGRPNLVALSLQDMTEHLEDRQKLIDAQYIARLGDFSWDLETNEVSWSAGMYRLMKYDQSVKLDFNFITTHLFHPDDYDRVVLWLKESIDSGQEWLTPNEYRLLCKDGTVIYVQTNGRILFRNGQPVKLFGTCLDITQRKQAEMMVAEQKGLLEAIYQNIPVVLILVDNKRLIQQVNTSGCLLAHRKEHEMRGLRYGDALRCLHTDASPEGCGSGSFCHDCPLNCAIDEVLGKHATYVQVEGTLPFMVDGQRRELTFLFFATSLTLGGETLALVNLLDITDRKIAEETLKINEASVQNKLRAILEPESDLDILELSDILDLPQLTILMEEFNRITGLANAIIDSTGKVVVGVGWQDICTKFHRVNPETLKNCIESDTILSQGVEQGFSRAYHCKNNLVDVATPIMLHGRHVGNIFTGQFFYSDEMLDIEHFRNQARHYGFNEQEYLNALSRVPRISQKMTQPIMSFLSKLAEIISSLSYSNIRLSKTITERERIEKEKSKLQEQLVHDQKMKAIGTLAGGIAHDFNNQLSGIIGYAEMLAEHLTDESAIRYARNIEMCATRSAELTKQLLTFSRKGKHIITEVNIQDILNEVCTILNRSLDKRIEIRQTFNATSIITLGDPTLLQNAFLNLAINARDAMPDGGILSFETSAIDLQAPVCEVPPFEVTPGDYIKISISDTGTGMTEATKRRIFEPFFTTKKEGKGTGMGLASVFGTVKSHKGAIIVYTELGKGTIFHIYLPVAEASLVLSKKTMAKPTSGIGTILLADDESIMRELGADMLRQLGYTVIVCENGADALDRYRDSWRDIGLVILDINMPRLNGHETFRAMQKINPDIRAIVASGYTINGEVQSMLEEGVISFIGKPFHKIELSEKVAQAFSARIA